MQKRLQNIPINNSLSIYLDLVRFLAAFSVFMGHVVQDKLYVGSLPLHTLSHEAVMIFFVLSGYVIANTASRPAETQRSFAIARLSRIYSVAIPAVILCYLIKGSVAHWQGGALLAEWRQVDLNAMAPILALTFLNQSWVPVPDLPWNAPYWSLSYEMMYYVIFGGWFFLSGRRRWWFVAAACLVAGPSILLLLPIWAIGIVLSQIRVRQRESAMPGLLLLAIAWGVIVLVNVTGIDVTIREWLKAAFPLMWRLDTSQRFVTDYIVGIAVALNFVGFAMLPSRLADLLLKPAPVIKYLAGFTFSLYLFHRPLTKAAHELFPNTDNSLLHALAAIATISLIIFVLGALTEQKKHVVRRWFDALLPRSPLARVAST